MQNLLVFAKGTNAHNKKFAIRGSAQREGRHWGPYYTANTLFENDQKIVSLLQAKPATFIQIFRTRPFFKKFKKCEMRIFA